MKIAIIGAAGVRTPIIIQCILKRQETLQLSELALMDIDAGRLEIITDLTKPLFEKQDKNIKVVATTDSELALKDADFVITTFRVGGIESRVIDERVALRLGVLGQETTGPGGFAMAMRTLPVLRKYLEIMEKLCPNAWLINFANPSGILAEAAIKNLGWSRAVGICDGPSSMRIIAAKTLGVSFQDIYLDYFGLNHLGWIRSVLVNGKDYLPHFLEMLSKREFDLFLPFSIQILNSLQMIPNEYLYYYYSKQEAINRILRSEKTRGEQISELNNSLFQDLYSIKKTGNSAGMVKRYEEYQQERCQTYMKTETGSTKHQFTQTYDDSNNQEQEGYAGVALDLIQALIGSGSQNLILNVLNKGAITGIPDDAVVEVPTYVEKGIIRPMCVGKIPEHCLGLINQVKAYERYTISAALEGSYSNALFALTIHPLVGDEMIAKKLLDGYILELQPFFPSLS